MRETHRRKGRFRHRMRAKLAATLVIIAACLTAVSRAPAQAMKVSADSQAKMETAIATFMTASKVPGLSVAVVQDGEIAWSAGFGMADVENSVPATSQTVYRIGSISKPFTATAAMALWEQGKLNLDSPVQSYCPAFPQKQWPMTTRQLLGHLGGIRYYKVPEYPYSESQSDPEVGNTRHFENGIAKAACSFSPAIRWWRRPVPISITPRKATRWPDAQSRERLRPGSTPMRSAQVSSFRQA